MVLPRMLLVVIKLTFCKTKEKNYIYKAKEGVSCTVLHMHTHVSINV